MRGCCHWLAATETGAAQILLAGLGSRIFLEIAPPSTSRRTQFGAHGHDLAHGAAQRKHLAVPRARAFRRWPCRSSRRPGWAGLRPPVARLHIPGHQFHFGNALANVGHADHINTHFHASTARLQGLATRAGAGEIRPFLGVRIGVSQPSRARWGFQVVEACPAPAHQFGAKAAGARGLVHHDAAAGLFTEADDGVQIQRPEAAQVDDLGVDAGFARPPRPPRPWCRRPAPSRPCRAEHGGLVQRHR